MTTRVERKTGEAGENTILPPHVLFDRLDRQISTARRDFHSDLRTEDFEHIVSVFLAWNPDQQRSFLNILETEIKNFEAQLASLTTSVNHEEVESVFKVVAVNLAKKLRESFNGKQPNRSNIDNTLDAHRITHRLRQLKSLLEQINKSKDTSSSK